MYWEQYLRYISEAMWIERILLFLALARRRPSLVGPALYLQRRIFFCAPAVAFGAFGSTRTGFCTFLEGGLPDYVSRSIKQGG
jgi:hypothetical protein